MKSVDSAEPQITSFGEQLSRPGRSRRSPISVYNALRKLLRHMDTNVDKSLNIGNAGSASTSSVTDSPVVELFSSDIAYVLSQQTSGLLPPLPSGERVLTGKKVCCWFGYLGLSRLRMQTLYL